MNISRYTLLALILSLLAAWQLPLLAYTAPFAYMTTSDGSVLVYDATNTLVYTISVSPGVLLQGIAITPDSNTLVVTAPIHNTIFIIDLVTNMVSSIGLGFQQPKNIAITPDGAYAYVGTTDNYYYFIVDIGTSSLVNTGELPSPLDITGFLAVAPNYETLYISDDDNNAIYSFSLTSPGSPTTPSYNATITVGGSGTLAGLAITSDSNTAYVVNDATSSLYQISNLLTTPSVSSPFPLIDVPNYYAGALILSSDDTRTYIASEDSPGRVNIFDIPPPSPASYNPVSVGTNAQYLAITPDNSLVYIPNGESSFNVIDTTTDSNISGSPFTTPFTVYGVAIGRAPTPPTPPAPLPPSSGQGCKTATGSTVTIVITWTPPAYGTEPEYYEVFDNPGLYGYPIATVPASGPLTASIPNQNPNTTYTYYVVSVDSYGDKSDALAITVGDCFFVYPPSSVQGCKTQNVFLLQTDLINNITWTAPTTGAAPVSYNIYRDPALTEFVATVPASSPLQYYDHNRQPNVIYSYYIASIDANGNVSETNSVTVTQMC